MVENIRYKGKIIARIIGAEELEGEFKFFTEDNDALQISRWNHPRGYECKPHSHNYLPKTITRTHEAIFVLSGEVKVTFYTLDGKTIAEKVLYPMTICHSMSCGHGYKVMSDGTCVVEFKNGPFSGDKNYDLERTLIDPNNFYANEQV